MAPPHRAVGPALILNPVDSFAARLGMGGRQPAAFGRIAVYVTGRVDEPAPLAPTVPAAPVRLDLVGGPGGHLVFFNRVTGADGVARCPYFAPGRYRLCVRSEYFRPLRLDGVDIGDARTCIDLPLEPGWRYPFPTGRFADGNTRITVVTGQVVDEDGTGAPGAEVGSPAVEGVYETDETGRFALAYPFDWNGVSDELRIGRPGGRPGSFTVAVTAGRINAIAPSHTVLERDPAAL